MTPPSYVPEEIWLGIRVGEHIIETFPSQETAASWAAKQDMDGRLRRFWKVEIPDNVQVYSSSFVPETVAIEEVVW